MQRTVQFWRITNAAGGEIRSRFPASKAVRLLKAARTDGLDRHQTCRDGVELIAHPAGNSPPMIILDKVRRQNLPNVGDLSGNRSALPLPEGNGLLEPTYFAFLEHNAVAVLLSGNGPRPKRLTSYLKAKMGVSIGLVPILREDFETVLREMRITRVDVAVPADRISRDLVGGDWVAALDGARQLAQEGAITIGMSVGRKSNEEKVRLGERFRGLVNELLEGGGIGSFKRARVEGRMPDGSLEGCGPHRGPPGPEGRGRPTAASRPRARVQRGKADPRRAGQNLRRRDSPFQHVGSRCARVDRRTLQAGFGR